MCDVIASDRPRAKEALRRCYSRLQALRGLEAPKHIVKREQALLWARRCWRETGLYPYDDLQLLWKQLEEKFGA